MRLHKPTNSNRATAFERAATNIRSRLMQIALSYLHNAEEAEDAVQETLMRCWTVRQRLASMDELPALATRVVKNLCTDWLRQRKYPTECTDGYEASDTAPSADEALIQREQEAWMRECLQRLPAGARAVLQMKGIDGLSYQEIAAILGTTEATVRAKMAKARQQLWQMYNKRK